jgi:hypothetical protein
MTAERFPLILEVKVSGLVESLMQKTGMGLNDALLGVYRSELYQALACEETKMWHHSPLLLLDCLESEFRTGKPEYPDE